MSYDPWTFGMEPVCLNRRCTSPRGSIEMHFQRCCGGSCLQCSAYSYTAGVIRYEKKVGTHLMSNKVVVTQIRSGPVFSRRRPCARGGESRRICVPRPQGGHPCPPSMGSRRSCTPKTASPPVGHVPALALVHAPLVDPPASPSLVLNVVRERDDLEQRPPGRDLQLVICTLDHALLQRPTDVPIHQRRVRAATCVPWPPCRSGKCGSSA